MLDGRAVLQKARHVYESCAFYCDEGQTFINRALMGVFATVYRRAEAFIEFSFTSQGGYGTTAGMRYRYAAIQGRLVHFEAPDLLGSRNPIQLRSAVAQLAGVTFGAAHALPRLLVPAIGGADPWPPDSAEVAVVASDNHVARIECRGALLDIELSSFNVLRYAFGEQCVTVYRPQVG